MLGVSREIPCGLLARHFNRDPAYVFVHYRRCCTFRIRKQQRSLNLPKSTVVQLCSLVARLRERVYIYTIEHAGKF